MNTYEAIKFLKAYKPYVCLAGNINEIIKLLERGDKYEAMWGDLKSECGTFFRDVEEGRCLGEMMAKMEYEWFPKPVKKTITIDKDLLSELAKGISKCFREWIEKHLILDLPITPEKLDILSDSIIKGIENSVKDIKEGE